MNSLRLMNQIHHLVQDGVANMNKAFGNGSEEWQMFTDYWKLCQTLWEPEPTNEYWENVIYQTDLFYKKYQTPFAKDLTITLVNDLDRRSRK